MTKLIKCLFTAVEADPLVKVGGLADVAFALPNAIKNLNPLDVSQTEFDIRLMIPCHATACKEIERSRNRIEFVVPTPSGNIPAIAYETEINKLPIYLIASSFIPQSASVYSTDAYKDGLKFIFFSLATLELSKIMGWQPDIIHTNDWHTSITNHLIHIYQKSDHFFDQTKRIVTIHNLPFLGAGTEKAIEELGIPFSKDQQLPAWARKLPLPMGLAASDKIVAVSPSYANEIQTTEFGCGLEDYLQSRNENLLGIINGIDTHSWNPSIDKALFANFSLNDLDVRLNNKHVLQSELNLKAEPDVPLLAYIGRMDQQKGVDLIIEALKVFKDKSWQAIILGTGNRILEDQAKELEVQFPDTVRTIIRFDSNLARKIYGGADILIMPSRYEPCGLAQMIAMRYGCVPIGRATGGLKDTITDINNNNGGTGLLFQDSTSKALASQLVRAIDEYCNKTKWRKIQINGMKKDFSWKSSALEYTQIYLELLRSK